MKANLRIERPSIITLLCVACVTHAATVGAAEIRAVHDDGSPAWAEGELGIVELPDPERFRDAEPYHAALTAALSGAVLESLARHFGASGAETIQLEGVTEDGAGATHLTFVQRISDLEVVGSGFRVRLDTGDEGSLERVVERIHGRFYPHRDEYELSHYRLLDAERALTLALRELGAEGEMLEEAQLVFLAGGERPELAYEVLMALSSSAGPEYLYVGATDGRFLQSEPIMIPGLPPGPGDVGTTNQPGGTLPYNVYQQRFVARTSLALMALPPYDFYPRCNQVVGLPLPGFSIVPVCDSVDDAADRAQLNQIKVYRYYANNHGRRSFDDSNSDLESVVHWGVVPYTGYSNEKDNAFWHSIEKRMFYGEGDVYFIDLTHGFDVAAHEMTHGVTDETSDLVYQKQPGALNESISDIFAAAAEAWDDGAVSNDTWLIGEDVVTASFPGPALRFMHNPSLDGQSPDHFSNLLYPDPCTPNSSNDYCGVHRNSGIPNLAFYLMVEGGTHPTGKSNVVVTGIGMEKAAKIFYYANVHLLNPFDDFGLARLATEEAASTLYDGVTAQTVSDAWSAVGVVP